MKRHAITLYLAALLALAAVGLAACGGGTFEATHETDPAKPWLVQTN